jgi:ethanolaminephosphotransferase
MCESKEPTNASRKHCWFIEETTANDGKGSLTTAGVENIACHKYKPGHYTHLDNILNPFWTWITDLLPMTMAPNMVTTIGGIHCAMSYLVLWYHSPNMDQKVPDWVVAFSGYCILAYYTFDCMDGKQARRTGTSSPLGQLFDHGFDCLCVLSHVSSVAGYLMMGGSHWYLIMQASLQFAFFLAQWEEYYTEILPHAMGDFFGVTEVNYGIGMFAIVNSFLEREQFWLAKVQDVIIPASMIDNPNIPAFVANLEIRHFGLSIWFGSLMVLALGCFMRVFSHENVKKNNLQFTAISKLFTPILISVAPFVLLPTEILFNETRYVSIATGLLFSLLTKKIIVFSMAKMSYATFQKEAFPLYAVFLWIRLDSNITEEGASMLLGSLSFWYVYRMLSWISTAIDQICNVLGIFCFSIRKRNDGEKKTN